MAEYTITEPYEFTIQRGSEEWSQLKRARKIYDAYQIPEDTLSVMTTEAIIETFIGCRFISYSLGYDDVEGCFGGTCRKVNMYEEMIYRDDYKVALIRKYLEICNTEKPPADSLNSFGVHKTYHFFVKVFGIEMLLGQPILIEKLSALEKKNLLAIVNDRIQSPLDGKYGYSVQKTGVFYLAHNLLSGCKEYDTEYNNATFPSIRWAQLKYGQSIIKKYISIVLEEEN